MGNKNTIVKTRDSGVELLRIILMLQVIYLHVSNFGKFAAINLELGGIHELIYWLHQMLSRCPVYVFILISGYFSVTSKATIKNIWPKAGKVYSSAVFYSLGITLLLLITGITNVDLGDIVKSFFPLTSRTWYFISTYLIVFVLSPVVNLALTRLSKKEYAILIAVLFFLFSIWQIGSNVAPFNSIISVNSVAEATKGRGIYGFLFMYILGGYIRLHLKQHDKPRWRYLAMFFGFAFIDVALVYLLRGVPILENYLSVVNHNNAPIAIMQGVCLLLFFRTVHFKSKIINKISSHNLGVYMFHEHWLMRGVIWDKLFVVTQNPTFYASPFYLIKIYGIIIAIYAVGTVIDMGRELIFNTLGKLLKKLRKNN